MHVIKFLLAFICGLCVAAPPIRPPYGIATWRNATPWNSSTAGLLLGTSSTFAAKPSTSSELSNVVSATIAVTSALSTPPPLWCGVHYSITPGDGFSICNGNWVILDFCSSAGAGYEGAIEDGHLKPRTQYYPLEPDSGIVLNLRTQMDYAKCDFSSKPPENPTTYGDKYDPWCIEILGTLMNDCDTTTTTAKMGGTKAVGCDIWSMFSVSGEAGRAFPVYSGGMDMVEGCKDSDE